MDYEIVNIEEKIVVGVCTKTKDSDPDMMQKIAKLWVDLYENGISTKIKNKVNEFAIGLYCDYKFSESGEISSYTVLAGNEVSKYDNDELEKRVIPAGKYAKFHVSGNVSEAVFKAWGEIFSMNLDRNGTCDFEEYLNADTENAEIDIYIGIN